MKVMRWWIAVMAVFLSGCTALAEHEWNRWPAMQQEKPLAILLVVEGNTNVPEYAVEYFSTSLPAFIANSGYYLLPASFSYQLLRDSGYKKTAAVLEAEPGAIKQLTGADAVLYVTVQDWRASTSIFATGTVRVAARYQLISTKTDTVLWYADSAHAIDTAVDQGGWLEDMLFTEIETSSVDIRQVAQQLNDSVFFALPPGKYNEEYKQR